jgi:hypothetical protein
MSAAAAKIFSSRLADAYDNSTDSPAAIGTPRTVVSARRPGGLEDDVVGHGRRRYSKQFSMVNVNMPMRRSPSDDGSGA